MREGRGEEGREGGRKGKRKGGRNCYALWGPSVHALVARRGAGACVRSSQLVLLLLCPRHLMVVGAIAVWSLSLAVRRGRGWLSLLPGSVSWVLIVIVGVRVRMRLLIVVGVHVRARAVVIVDMDVGGRSARLRAWPVGGCCRRPCRLLCTYHGRSCSRAVISRCWRWSLWAVVAVCCCLLVVVGGGRWRSSMVVVRRKEATSHIVTMASRLSFHVRSHVNDLT